MSRATSLLRKLNLQLPERLTLPQFERILLVLPSLPPEIAIEVRPPQGQPISLTAPAHSFEQEWRATLQFEDPNYPTLVDLVHTSNPSSRLRQTPSTLLKQVIKSIIGHEAWEALRRIKMAIAPPPPPPAPPQFWEQYEKELEISRYFDEVQKIISSRQPSNETTESKKPHALVPMFWLELGGAEIFARDCCKTLKSLGYSVTVVTDQPGRQSWENEFENFADEILHISRLNLKIHPKFIYEYLIKSRDISLIHIHHSHSCYQSLPHLKSRFPNLRIIDTLHIIETEEHNLGFPPLSVIHYSPFIDVHHVISNTLKNELVNRWGANESKIRVIYLGTDTEKFKFSETAREEVRTALGVRPDQKLIGFVGRLHPQKQPDLFLDIAAALTSLNSGHSDHYRFLMVGSGPMKDSLIKQISDRPLVDRVTLIENCRNPSRYYSAMDLLLITSTHEGLALVLFEALSCGLPVISTDVGAHGEILGPEKIINLKNHEELIWEFQKKLQAHEISPLNQAKPLVQSHQTRHQKLIELYSIDNLNLDTNQNN
jgi:glycosyltransferase involved in cell wall biosynthesis